MPASLVKAIFAAVLATAIVGGHGCDSSPKADQSAPTDFVDFQHWYAYYGSPGPATMADASATCPTGVPPPNVAAPISEVCSLTNRSLYNDDSAGALDDPDMPDFVRSEFSELKTSLPASATGKLTGWSVAIEPCSSSGPVEWTSIQETAPGNGKICISPILIRALFFQSADGSLSTVRQYLEGLGINPQSFDGKVPDNLPKKYTADDFLSVIGSEDFVQRKFVGAIDFILSRAMAEIYVDPAQTQSSKEARVDAIASSTVHKSQGDLGVLGIMLVQNLLHQALGRANADPWEFEKSEDVHPLFSEMTSEICTWQGAEGVAIVSSQMRSAVGCQ